MNAIIIPRAEAFKYRKIKLNQFSGMDAIELDSGDYFIKKECFDMLPVSLRVTRNKERFYVRSELSMLAIRDLKKVDFKINEIEIDGHIRDIRNV